MQLASHESECPAVMGTSLPFKLCALGSMVLYYRVRYALVGSEVCTVSGSILLIRLLVFCTLL